MSSANQIFHYNCLGTLQYTIIASGKLEMKKTVTSENGRQMGIEGTMAK